MILACSCIQYADLPPESSPHFHVEGLESEVHTVSVNANRLCNADDETCESPDHPRIAVPPQTHQEQDQCLQHYDFFCDEEVGARECLLDSKPIPGQQDRFTLSKSCKTIFSRQACDCAVVDGEE